MGRRSSATSPWTSSRRWPPPPPVPALRSPTSFPTDRSSPLETRDSDVPRPCSSLPWNGILRYPRDHLQLHHEVRRGHQEGLVRQHCPVRWPPHVPRYCRQDAEGDHRPGSQHNEDQDHRSPREEVLCLDRRIHPRFSFHLPADVDLQAGVRRIRPLHRAQEVLLRCFFVLFYCISTSCHQCIFLQL